MMSYPFPSLLNQLQFLCAPIQYEALLGSSIRKRGALPEAEKSNAYWQIVPAYKYAECPICHFQNREAADTYSLRAWGGGNYLREALYGTLKWHSSILSRCHHFLGIAQFYNLHGNTPDELDWYQHETGEVPVVTPWLMPDDIESYAVLHALPICRIERDQFVPRYTIFTLTYFAIDPQAIFRWLYSGEHELPEFATLISPKADVPDLSEWAWRGKLGWLDFTKSDLPLQIEQVRTLPDIYQNIQGSKEKFYWKIPGRSYR
jgi:hypothetical protein